MKKLAFFFVTILFIQQDLYCENVYDQYIIKGNAGVINKITGRKITPPMYDYVLDAENGYIWVNVHNNWGLIDSFGALVLPMKYKNVQPFSEELSYVSDSVQGGFINVKGVLKIPISYQSVEPFSNGFAAVLQNELWSYIDTTGKLLAPFKYDHAENFSEGFGKVVYDDVQGFIDKNGNEHFYPQYKSIDNYEGDVAVVTYETFMGSHYGLIDKNGKEIILPDCYNVKEISSNLLQLDHYYYSFIYNKQLHKITDTIYNAFYKGFNENLMSYGHGYENTFIDTNLNILKIDSIYSVHGSFNNNRCMVVYNDKYGFINEQGKLAIPAIYEDAKDFNDGFAAVSINDKYGFIDTTGKLIIDYKFDKANNFYNGIAVVKVNDKFGYINTKGEWIAEPIYTTAESDYDGFLECSINYKRGLLDCCGNRIMPFEFGEIRKMYKGFFEVRAYDDEQYEKGIGLYSLKGKEVIPIKYKTIDPVKNGLFIVRSFDDKYGVLDDKNNAVVPIKYDAFYSCDEIYYVGENDLYGIMDENFNWIVKPMYALIKVPTEGFIYVETTDDKSGFINKKGEVIGSLKYDKEQFHYSWRSYTPKFNRGRAILPVGEKMGMIDQQGKEILKPIYDDIVELPLSGYTVWNAKGGAVMDSNGVFITDFIFDSYKEINEGIGMFKVKEKYGLIDARGKELCKPVYDEIKKINFGIAVVVQNTKYGCIDREGKLIIQPFYDYIDDNSEAQYFIIQLNEKYGIADRKGNILYEPQFDKYDIVNERIVMMQKDKKWAAINVTELTKPDFIFDEIDRTNLGTELVTIGNKQGLVDEFGNISIPVMYDNIVVGGNVFYDVTLNGKKIRVDRHHVKIK